MADITRETEPELMVRQASLTRIILKVTQTHLPPAEFLAVVNPWLIVISVGDDNPFGYPSGEVVDSLKQKLGQENIYHTNEDGIIEFITNGERPRLRMEKWEQ